jgi:hypothetical protein
MPKLLLTSRTPEYIDEHAGNQMEGNTLQLPILISLN